MSGKNESVLNLPPGVNRDGTDYSVGPRWRDASLVRWVGGVLMPIGGWVTKARDFGEPVENPVTGLTNDYIRDTFSWKDYLKNPWYVVGSEAQAWVASNREAIGITYEVTPSDLDWAIAPTSGYGSGPYGDGPYGGARAYEPEAVGQWSFDNFGRQLVAVHSQDGRLLMWDPITPSLELAPVAGAPTGNNLVITTDERMVMVLGGPGTPRRVQWCDQEDLTEWTSSATTTAGKFDLTSSGTILAAVRVQGGILVLTDVDAHIIEYVGPPFYYGRRRVSEEVGIFSKNAIATVTGGAYWLSNEGFWQYTGVVSPVPCEVAADVVRNSKLSNPQNVFMGYNAHNGEIWTFYPSANGDLPDRYVFLSVTGQPYWSVGRLARTAFLNPVWEAKPVMFNLRQEYRHEVGWDDAGASRDVWALTGAVEISDGDVALRADRITQDDTPTEVAGITTTPGAFTLEFKMRQAPSAPERVVGPVALNTVKGYTTVRFRARQIQMKVQQVLDAPWLLGKLRLRVKGAGKR